MIFAHQNIPPLCVNGLTLENPFPPLALELELDAVFFGTKGVDPAYLEIVVLFEAPELLIGSKIFQPKSV